MDGFAGVIAFGKESVGPDARANKTALISGAS